jgi:hypothetical protein
LNRLAARDTGPGLSAFLLVHEALHTMMRHSRRFAHLPFKTLNNIAADYAINAMIVRRNRELILARLAERQKRPNPKPSAYFFAPVGGNGTRVPVTHAPLPVICPV